MEFIETAIKGVIILKPRIYSDERGYFMETYRHNEFTAHVGEINFVQDNESSSTYGVVRGLHFQQAPHAQAKLVRCVSGIVQDIAVDLRADSPTYGQHVSVILRADEGTQLFIPRGFAHGFAVLSPRATFQYKCDAYYHPQAEGGINPYDPALGIDWLIPQADAILSEKDCNRPNLNQL